MSENRSGLVSVVVCTYNGGLYIEEQIDSILNQTYKAIEVIKDFAKEKFPVFAGAIDKVFDKYNIKEDDDFLE